MEDKKKRIFISGPMTGVPNYMVNFAEASLELKDAGYTDIINPAVVNNSLASFLSYSELVEMCYKELDFCDQIYMLHGWENSKGANIELAYAKSRNMEVLFQDKEKFHTDYWAKLQNVSDDAADVIDAKWIQY